MILPMARVELVGPRDLLPAALRFLQAQGVLELHAPPSDHGVAPCAAPAELAARAARAEEALRRIDALRPRLPAAHAGEQAGPLPEPGTPALLEVLGAAESQVDALEARRAALVEESAAVARFTRLVEALAPLRHTLDPSLAPEMHAVELRNDPEAVALLANEVRSITGGACEVSAKPLDAERTGVLVVVPRVHGRAVTALLFERGVDEVRLPAHYAGKGVLDLLLLVAARARTIPGERAAADEALVRVAGRLSAPLDQAAAAARAELERLRAVERCGATRFAFVATGYMPAERVPELRRAAAVAFGERVGVFARPPARAEWEDVPVVLRNWRALRPFERLLALVPLPRYGSTDPTPWLALFFPLFFGLVLGDVVFGALGVAVAIAARARRWGGALGRDLTWIALACSLWAIAFGVLFGEALGELGAHVGLHPVLMDRRAAFMAFLGFALAIGGVHVAIGMALGVAGALRAGHRREAIGRAAKLGLLCTGGALGLVLAELLPDAALRPALAVGAILLAAAVAAEGPMAALELVLGLGNVLSYARLMALGLASVMLAEVANLVAGTLRPVAAGVAIGVLLHVVNCTLCLISPIVAALRLHYVEFFEKFYDEGGAPYRPFALAS